jgi:hypothetical protein
VGTNLITSFNALSLGGASSANYTLTGASGAVTITASGYLTRWFGIFNSTNDIAGWVHQEGQGTPSYTNDAPAGGPSTGAVVLNGPGSTWNGIRHTGVSINCSNYTAFEFDVKNEGAWDSANKIVGLNPILNPAGGYYSWSGPDLSPIATNNGWQHIIVPASAIDGLNIINWANITSLDLTDYEGNFTTNQTMNLGFSNIKFTGAPGVTPAFSNLTSHTNTYGAVSVTLTGTVGLNGFYLASNTVVTVTINGSPQTTNINDSTGDFTINYNTASLSVSGSPYTVTYTSDSDSLVFLAATNTSTTLTVNPQTPVVETLPTATAIIYGQTLASSSLSGGTVTNAAGAAVDGSFAFTTPGIAPNAGTTNVSVTFTPTDATDYSTATATVSVTVNPQTPPFVSGSQISAPIISNGSSSLSFYGIGIPGYSYVTQRATNLESVVWVNISTNTAATNGVINVTDYFSDLGSNAPPQAFYRLNWSPSP